MTNKEIRDEMKKKRSSMPREEVEAYSDAIFERIKSLDAVLKNKSFMIYKDFKNEVKTNRLTEYLIALGKTIAHPVTLGEKMIAAIPEGCEVIYDSFGVEIPKHYSVMKSPDVIFVPLVACDEKRNRLGFGKGYYDRYMRDKSSLKIGLCYDFQVTSGIEVKSWDVMLDMIVTEKRIII